MTIKTTPNEVYDLMEKHHGSLNMKNGEVTLRTDRLAALIDEVRAEPRPMIFSDADQRDLTIGRAINRCAMELPDGTSVICDIELGQATVFWSHEDDISVHLVDSDAEFSERILQALELTKQVRQ